MKKGVLKNKKWLWLLLVPVVFVGIPVWRALSAENEDDVAVSGAPVVIGVCERRDLEERVSYPATLTPETTITITPKIPGRVLQIYVREGDAVREGQLLVRLEDEAVTLQMNQAYSAYQAALAQFERARTGVRSGELENAQASLEQARSDLALAETNLERTQRLYEAGAVARARFEDAQSQVSQARTALANAERSVQMMEEGASSEELEMAEAQASAMESQYDLARLQASYASITASASGTVAAVLVDEGNIVGQTSPLLAIVSETMIFARSALPERLYGRFYDRQDEIAAEVVPAAYADRPPFEGSIAMLSPVIDPSSRTFGVDVGLTNAEGLLRPGMYANTEFTLARIADALVVPASAVLRRGDQDIVFVVMEGSASNDAEADQGGSDGNGAPEAPLEVRLPASVQRIARATPVSIGLRSGDAVQILEGLSGSETIIVEGNAFLEDGQNVQAVNVR